MARIFHLTPSRWLFAIATVLIGIGLAWWTIPIVEREWALRSLFSAEPDRRSAALRWLFESERDGKDSSPVDEAIATMSGSETRLARDEALARRILSRLEAPDLPDAIFSEAVFALREADWWIPDQVPPDIWCRRISLLLDTNEEPAARTALDEIMMLSGATAPALVDPLWQSLIKFEASGEVRLHALHCGIEWLPAPRAERLIVAPALEDDEPLIRRHAWIALALMDPQSGYQGDWHDERDHPNVAEAILWASISTNPDVIAPLQRAVEQSPWPSEIVPYLLSHCSNPDTEEILDALARDGNPAVHIPLLERFGESVDVAGVSAAIRAWLGLGAIDEYEGNPVAQRWWTWRQGDKDTGEQTDGWSLQNFVTQIGDVRADDGSVWAAVLLAERMLSPADASSQARQWMRSMNDDEQRAGLLLAGLLGDLTSEIERLEAAATNPKVRQYTRLARLASLPSITHEQASASVPDPAASKESRIVQEHDPALLRGFAFRLLRPELMDADLDVMLALLAAGDHEAASILLDFRDQERASERLLRTAWLIERFMPNAYDEVVPLSPWNEDMAALQLDVLRVAYALGFDSPSVDAPSGSSSE